MWYVWLIFAGIFFIAEIATIGFLIFWLGIGALLAMITSFFTYSLLIQTAVFVVSSCILIPLTKPLVTKCISKSPAPSTNAFSLIGKEGIVISAINGPDEIGQVKVNGEVWSAICTDDINLEENTKIKVLKIDGVKLVVEPKIVSHV